MIGAITIVGFLMIFLYFKVLQYRSQSEAIKRSYAAKGNMAIGFFFISFAVNSYVQLQSSIAAFVLVAFVLFGGVNIYLGYKHFKALQPYVDEALTDKS